MKALLFFFFLVTFCQILCVCVVGCLLFFLLFVGFLLLFFICTGNIFPSIRYCREIRCSYGCFRLKFCQQLNCMKGRFILVFCIMEWGEW